MVGASPTSKSRTVANVGGEEGVTQSTTSGGKGNGNVATVTPTVTVLDVEMGSVVPKGTATWAGGTQRSGGGKGRGRRGKGGWAWVAGGLVGGWVGGW